MVTTKESKDTAPPEISDARRIITLVVGDAIAFLVFAAIGRGSHGEATGLAAIPQIALTAAPFAAAWFIVAPFAGAYRRELTFEPRKMATYRTRLGALLACSHGPARHLRRSRGSANQLRPYNPHFQYSHLTCLALALCFE
jgi:hypothetical protein